MLCALAWLLPLYCIDAAGGAASSQATNCLDITQVTAFAPRGEAYVTVTSKCREAHFDEGDPVLGSVEILVGSLPPRHEELSVYRAEPDTKQTLLFENLSLQAGKNILVRLYENGDVVEVLSTTVR